MESCWSHWQWFYLGWNGKEYKTLLFSEISRKHWQNWPHAPLLMHILSFCSTVVLSRYITADFLAIHVYCNTLPIISVFDGIWMVLEMFYREILKQIQGPAGYNKQFRITYPKRRQLMELDEAYLKKSIGGPIVVCCRYMNTWGRNQKHMAITGRKKSVIILGLIITGERDTY